MSRIPEVPGAIPTIFCLEPKLPGGRGRDMEFSEEFLEETAVLDMQVFDSETPFVLGGND